MVLIGILVALTLGCLIYLVRQHKQGACAGCSEAGSCTHAHGSQACPHAEHMIDAVENNLKNM